MNDLNARLLAAHAAGDKRAMSRLYQEAADLAEDDDSRAFLLTQAFVFALDSGSSDARKIAARLRVLNRL